ncbi:methyl-accepting chemotaxis protein [Falsiroseomonas sp.]|uniref:methyl-accepting chemotaxis protein n=1 Tax=Falsiroseomonas sp. TaxID=2870721 RepID=UPI0035679404
MRNNGPVTDREILLPETEMLVSHTDPGGRISFCNHEFVRISGFDGAELTGAPHNIVRHPDMPQQAFRNLWETIKAGKVWEGLVKNRTKSGDFYWVRANVTPVIEAGQLQGFLSIRVKPERAEVERAAAAYARFRAGTAGGLALREGEIVSTSPMARLGRAWRSVTGRLALAGASFAATLGTLDWLGAAGAPVAAQLAVSALGLGLSGTLGWLALALMRASLAELQRCFAMVADGDYHTKIPAPPAAEFHDVVMRLRGMRAKLGYTVQERAESERAAALDRKGAIADMAERIEGSARQAMEAISARTAEMAREADGMAAAVTQVRHGAEGASDGAREALANVQAVAAATEQLAASVREITEQAARAGTATQRAVEQSERSQATIRALSASLGKVEEVVQLIRRIAEQTNLLALNATIEAARAGEAGKGFAVVAGEVKELATQTARSTEEITRHIGEILNGSRAAVAAVDGIGQSIAEICGVSSSIAAAMEQQAAATQEIARNVAGSSAAVGQASSRAQEVQQAAQGAGALAEAVRGGSEQVDREVGAMRGALVELVRTSMADADRRSEPRLAVQQACTVQAGAARHEASLLNVSGHGCLVAGLPGLANGSALTLTVAGWGITAPFRVSGASARGLHLALADGQGAEGWTAQVARLIAGGRQAA